MKTVNLPYEPKKYSEMSSSERGKYLEVAEQHWRELQVKCGRNPWEYSSVGERYAKLQLEYIKIEEQREAIKDRLFLAISGRLDF